ncbi:dentin sialophosphoprotein-like isoform X2 [Haliotis rubra]|nr:dentin sialophosphoprotein-like isoform X2 [Haliotis rubra]
MPSRQEVWDAIPTTKTPEKTYPGLKPRKLVNNFTRVNHRYNHDPAYTSDEGSSLDGFLAMEDDSSSDSSDSDFCDNTPQEPDPRKKRTKHRVKNRRLILPSSGSDTESRLPETCQNEEGDVRKLLRQKLIKKTNSVDGTIDGDTAHVVGMKTGVKKSSKVIESSSDEDKPLKSKGRRSSLRRKKSRHNDRIQDSNNGDNNDDDQGVSKSNQDGLRVPALPSSLEPNTESIDKDNDAEEDDDDSSDSSNGELEDDSEDNAPRSMRKKRKSLLDSDSDNGCDGDSPKAKPDRAVRQKDRRDSLFKDFKQARSKYETKTKHGR